MQQYELEYNQKADEVDDLTARITEKDAEIKQIDQECQLLKDELKVYREKSHDLEQELDQIRQKNVETHNLQAASALNAATSKANNFDQELQKMKEVHLQQLSHIKEENLKLKQGIREANAKSSAMQEQLSQASTGQSDSKASEAIAQLMENL